MGGMVTILFTPKKLALVTSGPWQVWQLDRMPLWLN